MDGYAAVMKKVATFIIMLLQNKFRLSIPIFANGGDKRKYIYVFLINKYRNKIFFKVA